tara:strand:- start:55 stop:417 length:363 start_codon:yes stop_codon:yes gene_type:complete
MPVLTTIGGIPVYTTRQQAIAWGRANGLSGYHIHYYQGQRGYMGGTNHSTATGSPVTTNRIIVNRIQTPRPRTVPVAPIVTRTITPPVTPPPTRAVVRVAPAPSSGSSSGGGYSGGGGGY